MRSSGIQLQEVANNISTALDQVQLQPVHSVIDQGNHYLQQYGTFRSVAARGWLSDGA